MYDIVYTEIAAADLKWFRKHEQNIIIDGINQRLRYDPTSPNRNRKLLRANTSATWELRVGDFRVFYDVEEQVRIVEISRIGEKRGNALYFQGQTEDL